MKARCSLCEKQKTLVKSHAIPSAFFKKIIRNQDGFNLLAFDVDTIDNPEQIGNDAKDYLLCPCCESFLNNTYEKYVVTLLASGYLERKKTRVTTTTEGSIFHFNDKDLNGNHVVIFIMSVLWRASLLNIDFYERVNLSKDTLKWMREHIISNKKPNPLFIGVEIRTLVDTTGTYNNENLKEIITSPFKLNLELKPVIAMIFGGYLFEIIMPNKRIPLRKNQISKKTKIYLSKNIEISSIPELQM